MSESRSIEIATFAGGCFWCLESDFEDVDGVVGVLSGYAGGVTENPTYEEVAAGNTGHREAVQVYFDIDMIGYMELLSLFWVHIDPTDSEGEFGDRGFQYTSAIFVHNERQRVLAEISKKNLIALHKFPKPIVTPIIEYTCFYPAEEYHQNYSQKEPLGYSIYRCRSGRDEFISSIWPQ